MKAQIATEVDTLVNGAVLLNIPDELAWNIFIEAKDTDSIGKYFRVPSRIDCLADYFYRGIRLRYFTAIH